MNHFQSINPFNGQIVHTQPLLSAETADNLLNKQAQAQAAFQHWPLPERLSALQHLAELLEQDVQSLATLIRLEMGKRHSEAEAEVRKCAALCRYYAAEAPRILTAQDRSQSGLRRFYRYESLGIILAIMPWNFPFWQVFRVVAPALALGNAVAVKPAATVPQASAALENCLQRAGFPENLVKMFWLSHADTEKLIAHDLIQGVTLTGSEAAGRRVAALAGQALKPCVLELGGSDAFIVLADAEVKTAAAAAVHSRTINAGQSCIAAKRFIIEDAVYEAFMENLLQEIETLRFGDPSQTDTTLAPVAEPRFVTALSTQVQKSLTQGAILRRAGGAIADSFAGFAPVVLENMQPGMTAFDEETFGAIFAVSRVENAKAAIALANNHRYGLAGSLWTQDLIKAEALATELHSGSVFVNSISYSDPALPFGGRGASGFGRELAEAGLISFAHCKSYVFKEGCGT
jgi:succinate-semialdehyde dehydrogenase/glutarate-semialdehyde dehydrogenase